MSVFFSTLLLCSSGTGGRHAGFPCVHSVPCRFRVSPRAVCAQKRQAVKACAWLGLWTRSEGLHFAYPGGCTRSKPHTPGVSIYLNPYVRLYARTIETTHTARQHGSTAAQTDAAAQDVTRSCVRAPAPALPSAGPSSQLWAHRRQSKEMSRSWSLSSHHVLCLKPACEMADAAASSPSRSASVSSALKVPSGGRTGWILT